MKLTDGKNIMVYVEMADNLPVNGSLEVLAKARELALAKGEKAVAVLIGKELTAAAKTAIEAGADQAILVEKETCQMETYIEVMTALIEKYTPAMVLMAATQYGRDLAPALAQRFETGCVTDAAQITPEGVFTNLFYNGNILNDVKIRAPYLQIASVRSGSFSKNVEAGRTGDMIKEEIQVAEEKIPTKIVDQVKEIAEAVNLEEAEVIVAGGRGMGSKENFELVKQLAEVCGGVVGATRPAIEGEWISRAHQVGQSGKIVAPKLYIACGVSGATQHISGMIGSHYIVAINKDEDAPIFEVADLGIVGDVMKVIPLLMEEIKKQKEQ